MQGMDRNDQYFNKYFVLLAELSTENFVLSISI